jgi:membrane protein required for colicin V production
MNPIDIAIVITVLLFVFLGTRRGIMSEILGITGWIVAILLSLKFCDQLAPRIATAVPEMGQISIVLAFIILFAGIRLIFYILIFFFKKMLSSQAQSSMDRIGGFFLGLIHGILFICIIILTLNFFHIGGKIQTIEENSYLYPRLSHFSFSIIEGISKFIPQTKGLMDKLQHEVQNSETMQSVSDSVKNTTNGLDKAADTFKDRASDLTPEEAKKLYEKERNRLEQMKKEQRR